MTLNASFENWRHLASGKVRDLYVPADGSDNRLLLVASNRISAFDFLLEPEIPGKGALLTGLSHWWFKQIDMPNHLVPDAQELAPAAVRDRSMVVKKLEMLPIECVVRGAITGSGYQEYQATGSVCGIKLPGGLADGDLLSEPIYTPAYKAPQGEHDENITFEQTVELIGADRAKQLQDASLRIFNIAREKAQAAGVILADTKFEFGIDPQNGELVIADEVLTSDSSRYWDAAVYAANEGAARLESFDKQIVRNWLLANWDRAQESTPPVLPADIVTRTVSRYRELFERLTGETPVS
ncbi:phosphoribosylaminoimidazolesuccinocarboxamide synthase [Canibacter zhoujuaniae]|uniref:phosphoribosylaminoimidazolesuccinocarboxamide synthase n=1 Tax=Canibacter zhoujuaniae TaxID=2708343 RepID=UPI00142150EE|nr:phosphoribosylaminoimidazolesuccinocarboxamide synthase [Canibacter zhoujuaniae]